MKNRPSPEDIFLNDVKSLIQNLLINNPNYKSDYYSWNHETRRVVNDTKERATYMLERIDSIKHLVKYEENG